MKKLFMLVCLLFLGKSGWSQNAGDVWNEYSISKPKGRVLMMTYKDYDEVYSFGEVSEVKRQQNTTVEYFNKNGLICYKRIIDGAKRTEISFLYDGSKLIKRIKTQPKATESGVLYDTIAVSTYTYDDSGRMKTQSNWENNTLTSKDRFEYTPTGYIMYCYKGDGSLESKAERKGKKMLLETKEGTIEGYMDDADRLIQVKTNFFLGIMRSVTYLTYNKYGDLMSKISVSGALSKDPQKEIVYTRRPNGDVVASFEDKYSTQVYGGDETIYKYEYDASGNWTVQSNVTKKTRIAREIVYAKSDDDFVHIKREIEKTRRSLDSVLYEEKVLELRRIKEKEKAAAAKAKEIAETNREKQAMAADARKRAALATSRSKKIKTELMQPYYAEYPYICKTVWYFRDELSLPLRDADGSIYLQGSDCIFDPVDEREKSAEYYIGVQQTIIRSLNDKAQKKDCKTLERSLKKAGNDKQRVERLETWLENQGHKLIELQTDEDPQKIELLDLYHDYDEKLKTNKESVIANTGRNYIVQRLGGLFLERRKPTNLADISLEHLSKCVEVQKFVCQLLQDLEQEQELTEILSRIRRKYPNYASRDMLYLTFENYIKKHGITIPQK